MNTDLDVRAPTIHRAALDGGSPFDDPDRGCDLSLGNFDCPDGTGCVDYDRGTGRGACEPNAHGDLPLYSLCEVDLDCYGGLCLNGVCTHPCDYQPCPGGYDCDEDIAPGGICRAASCRELDNCDDGFTCEYSAAERWVCAEGAGGCRAVHTKKSAPGFGALALCLVLFSAYRRRARRA